MDKIQVLAASGAACLLYWLSKWFKSSKSNREDVFALMKNTPLVKVKSLSEFTGCNIYAKCEHLLPFSSKDRMICKILSEAKQKGEIQADSMIYEGSSGSTCYSVAMISKMLGLNCTAVISDDISEEKLSLLKSSGCSIISTKQCPYSNFTDNYVRKAKKLAFLDSKGFFVNQFFNSTNWRTHYEETGPELWADTNGQIDCFVSGAGTGGTIGGISKYLKERKKDLQVCLADVKGSGLHSFVENGAMFTVEETEATRQKYRYYTKIEGVGVNFLTPGMEQARIDKSFKVSDEEAVFMANYVYEKDGLFVGGSTAVNFCAVVKAAKALPKGSNVVTVIFDSGTKYTSKLFGEAAQTRVTSLEEIEKGTFVDY